MDIYTRKLAELMDPTLAQQTMALARMAQLLVHAEQPQTVLVPTEPDQPTEPGE